MSDKGVRWAIATAVMAAALWLVLGHVRHYPFVNFDDPTVIEQNEVIEGISAANIKAVFSEVRDYAYLPLYYASFWLDYAVGGKDPGIYHVLNLGYHLLAGMLLAALLVRFGASFSVAALATLLFLIHPAAVESVVWASGRKDVLSGVLMLLALLLCLRDSRDEEQALPIGAALVFLAALFTKASVFVLPLILLALSRLRRSDAEERSGLPLKKLVTVAGVAVFAVAVHLVIATQSGTIQSDPVPLTDQIPVMLGALARYAVNIFAPFNLSLHYHRPAGVGMDGMAWGGLLLLALGGVCAWRFVKKPSVIGLGCLWILIGLIPFNNIVPRFAGVMADRYLYVSLMGLAVAGCGLMMRFRDSFGGIPAQAVVVVLVAGFGLLAHERSEVWSDSELLWRDAQEKAVEAVLPCLQLGQVYEQRATTEKVPTKVASLLDESARLFARAEVLSTNDRQRAQSLMKLASLEARRGRYRSALDSYEQLDKVLPEDLSSDEKQELAVAAATRASAHLGVGEFEEAMAVLKAVESGSAVDREARHIRAQISILTADRKLKLARTDAGREAAIESYNKGLLEYREVIELWPDYEPARLEYVQAYIPANWLQDYHIDVTKLSNKLVSDFPNSGRAYYLRAIVVKDVDLRAAENDLKISTQLDPYREEPYLLLVQIMRAAGENKEAKLTIDMGLASLPDSTRLKAALCETYVSFGYHHKNTQALDLAAEAAARAREILPESPAAWQLTAEVAQEKAEAARKAAEKRDLWEEANVAWTRVATYDPTSKPARLGRALYHRVKGYAYLYTRLPSDLSKEARRAQRRAIRDQAMEEFLKAVQLAPSAEELTEIKAQLRSYAGEFRSRAEDLLDINDTARASVEIEKAMRFAPGVGENHAVVARIAVASLDFDTAEREYAAAVKAEPDNIRALFELGKLRFDRRQFEKAQDPLKRFLQQTVGTNDPALSNIRDAAEKLMETCRKKAESEKDG